MNATTAIATKPTNDVRALLAKPETIKELGRVATKHLTADRLARLVLSACNRVPKLLDCTPQSVLTCALTCSQYGVEPDGRHAHLIPYGNTCTLIIDWKGLVALGRRAGVEGIVADTICASDEFTYFRDEAGTHFKHVPKFGDRGEIIGAYSTARIDGQFDVEVMTRDEIEGIRKRSKAGGSGPWVTDFGEMAKKTAIRRHSKRWPLSEDVAGAFTADDDVPAGIRQEPEIRKPLFTTPLAVDAPSLTERNQLAGVDIDTSGYVPPSKEPRKPRAKAPAEPVEASEPVQEPEVPVETPTPVYESPKEVNTPNEDLAEFVTVDCRASFENLCSALVNLQWVKGAQVDVWTSFDDIPLAIVQKCLKSKSGLGARLEDEKALGGAEA
jgi:recombination protein RecT